MIVIHGVSRVSPILLRHVLLSLSPHFSILTRLRRLTHNNILQMLIDLKIRRIPARLGVGTSALGCSTISVYLTAFLGQDWDSMTRMTEGPLPRSWTFFWAFPSLTPCSELTFIDFWVSRTFRNVDSSSCTITSSSLVKGCGVTASATTTGAGYCPT